MDWSRLLSAQRFGAEARPAEPGTRSDFERDYHRILFSYPFRRLQGKTQVFPLPTNDHIHNRLTHTLEVAAVGRSLGKMVGGTLMERHPELRAAGLHSSDVGDIVSAAALAHDLGNPPFGHAGEDAIARWFRAQREKPWMRQLSPVQAADFMAFEGNAQGFRIVTRLSMYTQAGGMRLTAATIGSFAKYPQASIHARASDHIARKKFNYFDAECRHFQALASELDLLPFADEGAWHRHPLAYLVEAADDICYMVMDAEDGYLTGRFSFDEVCAMLEPIAGISRSVCSGSHDERVNRLRARAISQLVQQTAHCFLDQETALLAGTVSSPLLGEVAAAQQVAEIERISIERCYHDHEVVQVLLTGYRVVAELLSIFVPVALERDPGRYEHHIMTFLPDEVSEATTDYERLLTITDFISGMTDEYAVATYRRLTGIDLPGSRDVAAKR